MVNSFFWKFGKSLSGLTFDKIYTPSFMERREYCLATSICITKWWRHNGIMWTLKYDFTFLKQSHWVKNCYTVSRTYGFGGRFISFAWREELWDEGQWPDIQPAIQASWQGRRRHLHRRLRLSSASTPTRPWASKLLKARASSDGCVGHLQRHRLAQQHPSFSRLERSR